MTTHTNIEQARFNMIEQQIRTWEVLDSVVLDLLKQVPREAFVPKEYAGLAFADIEIPIGHGQTMLSPKMEGRILQAMQIKPSDKVLEIGTGSGYLTSLMAKLASQVHSVEILSDLAKSARQRISRHKIENVTVQTGDAASGWAAHAPYDVIVYTGSVPVLLESLQQQLNIGGRMFIVVGEAPVMEATMIQRISAESFKSDVLFETCLPSLVNAPQPERFEF